MYRRTIIKFFSLVTLVFIFFPSYSFSYTKTVGDYYVVIPDPGAEWYQPISRYVIIDKIVSDTTPIIYAYATEESLSFLNQNKINYYFIPSPDLISEKEKVNYPNHENLTLKLKSLAERYPNLLSLESIGQSVQGRKLWFMKISNNVLQDEKEVEIKFISSMHGNEIVGREILVNLIEELVTKYEKAPTITKILDNSEIWIMPSMNPDGTALTRRGNANNIDLNRDFPDVSSNDPNTTSGRAVETKLVMEFNRQHYFTLAANFHGGAVVVNYPWDHTPNLPPNMNFVEFLSKEYAQSNGPMWNSTSFNNGVTNGFNWYPVYGGMQDWTYYYNHCLELTIELSSIKWPAYSSISQFWQENRNSLIRFLELAQQNVHGIVIDAKSGKALTATYKIIGIESRKEMAFTTREETGEFYYLLLPGTYTIQFTAPGYQSLEKEIVVPNGGTQSLTIALNQIN